MAVALSPGLRTAQSTLRRESSTTRWLIGQWAFRPAWTVRAWAGVAYQFPEPLHLLASTRSRDLRPERAAHVDVGIERRVSDTLRWQATVFHREERDVLRDPAIEAVLPDVRITSPAAARYVNALRGRSRGIELLVERHSASALSGWFAYTYGKTRYTDVTTTETFWADFDQRHTFSLFGLYRMSGSNHSGCDVPGGKRLFRSRVTSRRVTMGSSWAVSGTPCDCPAMPAGRSCRSAVPVLRPAPHVLC